MTDYTKMLADYTATEEVLRQRTTALRQEIKRLPLNVQRDEAQKRLYVMQEELYDVTLVRLELVRRQREEELPC